MINGVQTAPSNCEVYNPAFDITPFRYITGIITEAGILYPPYKLSITGAKTAKSQTQFP